MPTCFPAHGILSGQVFSSPSHRLEIYRFGGLNKDVEIALYRFFPRKTAPGEYLETYLVRSADGMVRLRDYPTESKTIVRWRASNSGAKSQVEVEAAGASHTLSFDRKATRRLRIRQVSRAYKKKGEREYRQGVEKQATTDFNSAMEEASRACQADLTGTVDMSLLSQMSIENNYGLGHRCGDLAGAIIAFCAQGDAQKVALRAAVTNVQCRLGPQRKSSARHNLRKKTITAKVSVRAERDGPRSFDGLRFLERSFRTNRLPN